MIVASIPTTRGAHRMYLPACAMVDVLADENELVDRIEAAVWEGAIRSYGIRVPGPMHVAEVEHD